MTPRSISYLLILSFSLMAGGAPVGVASTAHAAGVQDATPQGEYAKLSAELRRLQEELQVKRGELAKLRHKWAAKKGRTPTEKEIEEFEKKRAKGTATEKDNPYVSKNPLSSPGGARLAYFKKLEEIRQDEERERRLKEELSALNP